MGGVRLTVVRWEVIYNRITPVFFEPLLVSAVAPAHVMAIFLQYFIMRNMRTMGNHKYFFRGYYERNFKSE